jgi:hypothetical protein
LSELEQLIALHGAPFFIKIDAEGYEAPVLKGLHPLVPYLPSELNLPEFQAERLECIELLSRLAPEGKCNYACGNGCRLMMDDRASATEFSRVVEHCSAPNMKCSGKRSCPPELDD